MNRFVVWMSAVAVAVLAGCAGERQGLVCDEMEYRLNTMTYSPDQRAYAEEELRVCREQETQKKAEGAAARQSIYDRFAASDSSKAAASADTIPVSSESADSSDEKTVSIYDRYKSVNSVQETAPAETLADTSAADAGDSR